MNKWLYVLLALFLGGIGAHKLYAGKPFMFLIYLCFCWTFVPAILGGVEALFAALTWE